MNKHAYLILAHTNLSQLKKLLSAIDDERNDIFIHIDKKAPYDYSDLEGICTKAQLNYITPRIKVNWGGYSIIKNELRLLKAATQTQHEYYHFLSGLDLPLKSQDYTHKFFQDNKGWEFLDFWEADSHAYGRVQYYALFPEGSNMFITNLLNHIHKAILKKLHIKRNRSLEVKKASQWMSITHDFARYIVEHEDWIDKVFKHSVICDEIFIPTLMWISPFKDKVFDPSQLSASHTSSMRLIDWSRGPSKRHPWTFTIDDFEMLKNSPCLWARKFDERTDNEIIDRVLKELASN